MQSSFFAGSRCHRWCSSPGMVAVWLFIGAAAIGCIAGCSRSRSLPSDGEALRIGVRVKGETLRFITESLFAEPLLVIDRQGRPAEGLATDSAWEDEGRTLRLHLRSGIRFHDGTPVAAETIAAILRQRIVAAPEGFEALERIDTPDARTMVFRLRRPDAFLTAALGDMPIVDPKKPDVGTGPFKIVGRTPALEAIRNDGYYRGRPGIARVTLVPYETLRATSAALMRGEVDVAYEVNRESIEFLEGASRVDLLPSIRPYYIPLVFNMRDPILGRVEVRRAIAEAVDRDEIVRQGMRGHGQPADDPVWPAHWAYNAAARRYSYNPAAARARLDAAHLPLLPAPPGSHRMASRFQISCLFWNDEDSQFERIGLLLQRQLAEVGIDLVLEGATDKAIIARIKSGKFSSYLFQMTSGRSFNWTYRFWHSPASNTAFLGSGYNGADEVLDRLRRVSSDAEIRIAVGDLRERFYEDVPATFLAWMQTTRGVDNRFDVGDRLDPEIFLNLWRWHTAPAQKAMR